MADMLISLNEMLLLTVGWVLAAVTGLLVIFYRKMTPAHVFFKSWISKNPVLLLMSDNGMAEFVNTKEDIKGAFDVKGVGSFFAGQDSHVVTKSGKTLMYFAHRKYSETMDKYYPVILQELKEQGFEMSNIKEVELMVEVINNPGEAAKLMKNIPKGQVDDFNKRKDFIDGFVARVKTGRTYKMHDMIRRFPYSATPERIDNVVAAKTELNNRRRAFDPRWLMLAGSFLVMAAVALVIISKVSPTAASGAVSALGNVGSVNAG